MVELVPEAIERQLPAYLTDDQKALLARELQAFRTPGFPYYTTLFPSDTLQGDGWTSFSVFDIASEKLRVTRGIVLSNTCDIAPENQRSLPPGLIFAPLTTLAAYERLLLGAGLERSAVQDKVQAIRDQNITSIFYLPAGAGLDQDHIALLDAVQSLPLQHVLKAERRRKLFTLSQCASYLFLLKLSLHFCRFHDKVIRYADAAQSSAAC